MHEASLYPLNCFVTLTYSDEHLPPRSDLVYKDFQKFMKRLRRRRAVKDPQTGRLAYPKQRFYACGEYGEEHARPHFHAILFDYDFPDKRPVKLLVERPGGHKLWTSKLLDEVWGKGQCRIGKVSFESAAYVARYCMKKVTGKGAYQHYSRVDEYGEFELTPEMAHMSLRPAVGKPWLDKFQTDVYPHDYVVVNGRKCKPPRYYDSKYGEASPDDFEYLQFQRMLNADARLADNTLDRLAVRETVLKARLNLNQRSL